MTFTRDSLVSEVLSAKPGAIALIEKYVGRPVQAWELAQAGSMSLQMVGGYLGWNNEQVEKIVTELNTL
jgi:hypothetical protein